MSSSPAVFNAATTLADWAHERRRAWSAEPLPRPLRRVVFTPVVIEPVAAEPAVVEPIVVAPAPVASHALMYESVRFDTVELHLDDVVPATELAEPPSRSAADVFFSLMRGAGAIAMTSLERLGPLADSAAGWLMRGAAVVSTMSVLLLVGINRGEVFARYDRAAAAVKAVAVNAATTAPAEAPPPVGPAKGSGRLTIASASGSGAAHITIDGRPRGLAPVTVELTAGSHRVLVSSEKGSIERAVKIQSGESSEMTEAIFPGWLAVTAAVDLTLSEGQHVFDRDERGWALMAPGPHDIHLDNPALGVHEVRHVLVKPGEPTWLSVVPSVSP